MTDESTPAMPGGTSDPDANGDGDGDGLPDAPLFALLGIIAERVGIDRIDRVWLFPPRRLKAGETSVVVVAAYAAPDDDRRRVYAAHYTAPADTATQPRLALDEFGSAPSDRVGRVVEEVVERIKEDAPPQPPRTVPIGGDEERWSAMLHELAEQFLEDASADPRLGR